MVAALLVLGAVVVGLDADAGALVVAVPVVVLDGAVLVVLVGPGALVVPLLVVGVVLGALVVVAVAGGLLDTVTGRSFVYP